MMIRNFQRSVALVVLTFTLCLSLVLQTSRTAEAFVPPSVPVLAATALGAPLIAAVGVTALGYGAWYAWSNRDQILSWLDGRSGVNTGGGVDTHASYSWQSRPPHNYTKENNTATFVIVKNQSTAAQIIVQSRCFVPAVSEGSYSGWTNVYQGTPGGVGGAVGSTVSLVPGTPCTGESILVDVRVIHSTNNGLYVDWRVPTPASVKRETQARITCRDAAGTTASFTSPISTSTSVKGSTATGVVPSCENYMPGSHQESRVVEDRRAGSADAFTSILSQTIPAPETTSTSKYKDCVFFSGNVPCSLIVRYQGFDCSTAVTECATWFTRSATEPGYTCAWGPYIVPLGSCDPLRWQYHPDQIVPSETEPGIARAPTPVTTTPGTGTTTTVDPDGDPQTQTQTQMNPDGSTTTTTTYFSEPDASGKRTPLRRTIRIVYPNGSTSTETQSLNPDGSPNGTPTIVTTPPFGSGELATSPDATDDKNCISGAFSFNPLNWVYVPVKCVLQWAFVPKAEVVTSWKTRIDGLKTRPPLSVAVIGSDFYATEKAALSGNGCAAPTTVTPIGTQTTTFDPICEIGALVQGTSAGRTIYGLFKAGAYMALAYFIWVRVFRSVGTKEITGVDDDKG